MEKENEFQECKNERMLLKKKVKEKEEEYNLYFKESKAKLLSYPLVKNGESLNYTNSVSKLGKKDTFMLENVLRKAVKTA